MANLWLHFLLRQVCVLCLFVRVSVQRAQPHTKQQGLVPMKGWQQPTAICLEPYFGVSMSAGSQDHLLSLQAMQLPGPDDSLLLTDLDGIENFWLLPAAVKPYLSHGTVPRMGDEGSAAPQMFGSFIHGIVLRTLRAKLLIALEASETSQTLP